MEMLAAALDPEMVVFFSQFLRIPAQKSTGSLKSLTRSTLLQIWWSLIFCQIALLKDFANVRHWLSRIQLNGYWMPA